MVAFLLIRLYSCGFNAASVNHHARIEFVGLLPPISVTMAPAWTAIVIDPHWGDIRCMKIAERPTVIRIMILASAVHVVLL